MNGKSFSCSREGTDIHSTSAFKSCRDVKINEAITEVLENFSKLGNTVYALEKALSEVTIPQVESADADEVINYTDGATQVGLLLAHRDRIEKLTNFVDDLLSRLRV